MKKLLLLAMALMLGWAANAQNTSACPGFKNPASFTSGSTSGANIGYYSGATGVKNNDSPNSLTGTTGYTMSNTVTAAQLANTTSSGSNYCGSTLDPTTRFRIMSATEGPGTGSQLGKDPIANNYALSYCPTEFDSSITKSIRLGNCYVDGAEALYYTMRVSTTNSLMSVYYAINVQNPSHGTSGNPAFVVRVCRQNGTTWSQISDTLCYAISSASAANNVDGWHSYNGTGGAAFYRDWNKVAINLIDYLYENVRLEFYIGDCVYNAHFGYCYIAGDCQPMEIKTSGCPAGATTVVTQLSAPEGLSNYQWYRSKTGGQYISNMSNIPNTVTWQPLASGTNNYSYDCQIEDFRIMEGEGVGELTNNMVFRCDMTSAMDPAKPFTSQLFARVNNTKPLMSIDTLKNCDGGVTLRNMSYVPNDIDGCDTANSIWWMYSGSNNNTTIVDSAVGAQIYANWDSCGQYAVRVRSFNADDHECYSDSTYTINVLCRPNPVLEVDPANKVCAADSVILHDATPGMVRHDWVIDDVIYPGPRSGNTNNDFGRVFTKYRTPVELVAYNGLFTRDSINTYDTIWCTSSAYDTIEVFQHPELL
ncbi:MAG: hypothetical protein KBT28_11665, partial [Bacteroidales bacterium]|nr:hypothetical protein [Candidatus Colimorpha merdihippi]